MNPAAHSTSTARWAIAIHGGAGSLPHDAPQEEVEEVRRALREALGRGREMLSAGHSGLDTVEAVLRILEDHPSFNAGKGAVFTAEGRHELDASIMNGADLSCGAVAGVRTVKNPIRLARRVMERTRHVLLAGSGAEAFADTQDDIERVPPEYFSTEARRKDIQRWREEQLSGSASLPPSGDHWKSTVGCVVLDGEGHLAAGTSTGGLTGKRFGRVGDSPIVGAGTYADDRSCAVSCTGVGEEYIRNCIARDVSDRLRYLGQSVQEAADAVIFEVLEAGEGGIIVLGADGSIAMAYNTTGMFRGAADSTGRFEVGIWEELSE